MKYAVDHRRNAAGNAGILGQGFSRVNRGTRADIFNYRADTRRPSIEATVRPDARHPLTVLPPVSIGESAGWHTPFSAEWRNPKDPISREEQWRRFFGLPSIEEWAAELARQPRYQRGGRLVTEIVEHAPSYADKREVRVIQSQAPEITHTALAHYDDDDPLREVHASWIVSRERDAERARLWENRERSSSPVKSPAQVAMARLRKMGLV